MSYLQFLGLFVVLPIGALLLANRKHVVSTPNLPYGASLALVATIAFLYTTPWDNYLVYAGVWYYGDARVLGTLFFVPYEEYAFFLLQPVLTGLILRLVLARRPLRPAAKSTGRAWFIYNVAWTAVASLVGGWMLLRGPDSYQYAGLILAWSSPVVLALTLFARGTIRASVHQAALAISIPSLYLWAADSIAIRLGIWTIADATSTQWEILGLPVEEAIFFLVTNWLVVFGVLTFAYGPSPSSTDHAGGS